MGEITVEIELENVDDRALFRRGFGAEHEIRSAKILAVADTGAIMLALPESVVTELGLTIIDSVTTSYADGRRGQLEVAGPLSIKIGDREMPTDCIVLPSGTEALIGQLVMERLDLIADCTNQTLHPRPESPDRPLLRV